MPKVPTYNAPQVQSKAAAPVFQSGAAASPEAFGAGIGAAGQGLSNSLDRTGNVLGRQALELQETLDANAVIDAHTRDQDAMRALLTDPDKGYLFRTGAGAMGMTAEAAQKFEEIQKKTAEGFTSDRQRLAYKKLSSEWAGRKLDTIAIREGEQVKVYKDASIAATVKSAAADATSIDANDEGIITSIDTIRRATYANGKGEPPEALEQKVKAAASGVWRQAIETRAAQDPVGAAAMLERRKGELFGQDLEAAIKAVRPGLIRSTAQSLVASITGRSAAGTPNETAQAITTEAASRGIDPRVALTTAQIESAMGTAPDAPGNSHKGVFQLGEAEWATHAGGADRGDKGAQVKAGISALKAAQDAAGAALGRTPEGWETYLTHQQGVGGGPALLKADANAKAADVLAPLYKGDRAKAEAAITGNGGKADMTAGQFRDLWKAKYAEKEQGRVPAGPPAAPDLDRWLQRADEAVTKVPAEIQADLREKLMTELVTEYHRQNQHWNAARADLRGELTDRINALSAGQDVEIDAKKIWQTFDGKEAEEWAGKVDRAKVFGKAVNELQWASPEDVAQMRARMTEMLKSPEDYAAKAERARAYEHAVALRQKKIDEDPAKYVASSPIVSDRWNAVDPKNPGPGTQAAITASLAEQARLGVAEQDRSALTNDQAAALVKKITSTPPNEADISATLDTMAKTYGPHWQKVYGELVVAKLPGAYQVLAAMDTPGQVAPRQDLQRALAFAAEKGGLAKLRADAPDDAAKDIDRHLDDKLSKFAATVVNNEGGVRLHTDVREAVKTLAYYHALQGKSGDDALNAAVEAILDRKYDFDGSKRVPKGMLGSVNEALHITAASLKPEDIAPWAGDRGLTEDQRKATALAASRRGQWVPSADDGGLVLMVPQKDGQLTPLRRTNGSMVEVRFDDVPNILSRPRPEASATPGPWAGGDGEVEALAKRLSISADEARARLSMDLRYQGEN